MKGYVPFYRKGWFLPVLMVSIVICLLFDVFIIRYPTALGNIPVWGRSMRPTTWPIFIARLGKITKENPLREGEIVLFRPNDSLIPSVKRVLVIQPTFNDTWYWPVGDNHEMSGDSRADDEKEATWIPSEQILARVVGGFPPLRKYIPLASPFYPPVPPPDEKWVASKNANLAKPKDMVKSVYQVRIAIALRNDFLRVSLIRDNMVPHLITKGDFVTLNIDHGRVNEIIKVLSIESEPSYSSTRHDMEMVSRIMIPFKREWVSKLGDGDFEACIRIVPHEQ